MTRCSERGPDGMPQLLTLAEAVRILRVHRNTVNQERAAGRLKFIRVGRRVLIDLEDLKAYLQQPTRGDGTFRNAGCLSTETTGSSDGPIRPISTSTAADRERDASDARARALRILKKPSDGS
jgi:excisionase family DNA binding protein